ncbi:DUF4190 domain-containing protein [Actinomadura adrarensis]|uniref:DUF4190 domain-containing protein n=1 Tax=Actinomadura adrarensis TaxID=1819600 RepID=A0ABW3CQA3_9ACTN
MSTDDQPPQAWNDPYNSPGGSAGAPPPGWDPYGQYGGGRQPYDAGPSPYSYGYGPPSTPQRSLSGSTIAALVCNIMAVTGCCNVLAIPGIVTSVMAISRNSTDPERAKTLTVWSWTILGVTFAIWIIFFAVLIIIDANSPDYYDDY